MRQDNHKRNAFALFSRRRVIFVVVGVATTTTVAINQVQLCLHILGFSIATTRFDFDIVLENAVGMSL